MQFSVMCYWASEFIPSVFREISLIGITDGAANVFCNVICKQKH